MARAATRAVPLQQLLPLVRDVVGRGGRLRVIATGGSMMPAIRPGDVIVLGPVPEQLQPGEVLVAADPARIHRLVRLEGDRVVLRGDACPNDDPPQPRTSLLARVERVQRDPPWRRLGRLPGRVLVWIDTRFGRRCASR